MEKKELVDKIKQYSNRFVNSIGFIIFIGILIFLKSILFYKNTISIEGNIELDTILGTFSFCVVLACFLIVLPNRARIVTSMIINFLLSLLLFGDNVYYTYSSSVLSVAQITNLQYGEEIINVLPMVLKVNQILYFLDLIIFVILLITKIIKIKKKEKNTKTQIVIKILVGIVGIVIFCIISAQYIENGRDKSYNKDWQIKETTIFGYHVSDIESFINIKANAKYKTKAEMMKDYEKLKTEYVEEYGIETNKILQDLQNILKDKNVIILQLESIQEFVVNKKINETEITPNLNKFLKENIEFTNMHMQSYSTTADSEHSTITSLYPMENGMSFSRYFTNTYDDIFKEFNNAGYFTSYMHGNYSYFWNRGNVYSRLNLNDVSLKDKFEDVSEDINGYLSDELLYRQAVEKLQEFDNPFISYIVAASSHTPFFLEGLEDRSKVTVDVGQYKDTYFGNYIEAVNYADYAFGVFIQELKKAGLYEDTAILVFGDHNGINMYNEEMIEFLEYTEDELTEVDLKLNYTRVLCGFKIPGVGKAKIEKPINKLDIKPTLCYLCGVEDGVSIGTNMFKSKDFVALNNERIISQDYYYDENWYNIETGEEIDIENTEDEIKEKLLKYYEYMKTELNISNSITVNNLLK